MAILELRASRGWSLEQAAKVFLVTAETISSWVRRIDETGTEALVQTFEPVNKFPDLVRYLVQRLKVLCPSLGKQKLAQVLCRAGLHLGTTTVGRILKEAPHPKPPEKETATPSAEEVAQADKYSAALRGTRPPRLDCGGRAIHPDGESRMHAKAPERPSGRMGTRSPCPSPHMAHNPTPDFPLNPPSPLDSARLPA